MKRHRCAGCLKSFLLQATLEPFVCEECDRLLCPLCAEDGCCRRVAPGDVACGHCVRGMVEVAGDCMSCGGLGCYVDNGITRECPACGTRGWLDVSLCGECGGYGWITPAGSARVVKKRSA